MAGQQAAPVLVRHDHGPWHLHFTASAATLSERWCADLSVAVAVLLGSAAVTQLKGCAAENCDRLFLDTTRSRTRRFCGSSCQNRVKVTAFRRRAATRTPQLDPG